MFLLPVLFLFKSSLLHAPRDKPPCKCDMTGVPFPQWRNTTADVLLLCPSVFRSSQWLEQGGEPLTSSISYYEFWEEWVNCTSVPQAISSTLRLSQLDNIAIIQIGKSGIVSTGALYTVFSILRMTHGLRNFSQTEEYAVGSRRWKRKKRLFECPFRLKVHTSGEQAARTNVSLKSHVWLCSRAWAVLGGITVLRHYQMLQLFLSRKLSKQLLHMSSDGQRHASMISFFF